MLSRAAEHEASDPRDLVYGVIGMIRSPSILQPDYSAGMIEVYRDAIRRAIGESGEIRLLQGSRHRLDDNSGSSSWVVRFDRRFNRELDNLCLGGFLDACAGRKAIGQESETLSAVDPWLLNLSGFAVATVDRHTDCLDGWRGGYRTARAFCGLDPHGKSESSASEPQLRELCFALTAGANFNLKRARPDMYLVSSSMRNM